jgi:hypothetical protein
MAHHNALRPASSSPTTRVVATLAALGFSTFFALSAAAGGKIGTAPSLGGSYGRAGPAASAPVQVNTSGMLNRGHGYRGHGGHGGHGHYNRGHRYYGGGGYYGGWGWPWGWGYGHGAYLGASWYRPGLAIGLTVPLLPLGYTTHYVDRTPYYYHDSTYYLRDGDGYRVVDRPPSQPLPPGPAPVVAAPPVVNGPAPTYVQPEKTGQLFAYPRNNQSATTATFDRIECEKWASEQTGFQPAQSADNATNAPKKSDYQRAVAACLEGRGYSVR